MPQVLLLFSSLAYLSVNQNISNDSSFFSKDFYAYHSFFQRDFFEFAPLFQGTFVCKDNINDNKNKIFSKIRHTLIYFHSFHTLYRIPSSVLPSRVPSGHRQGQRICRHNRLQSAVRRWKMPKTNNQYPFIKKAIYSGSVSRQSFLPTL